MQATTRFHVGSHEIGIGSEYRVECVGTLGAAREWLRHDVEAVAEHIDAPAPFDKFLDRVDEIDIVGEHVVGGVFTFWVRAVENCGCPCGCAERGESCDGVHRREALT
ncbi:hypothetical protein [Streptomyces sp. NPDC051561]|uniref:hypothetical protein n=1 Tax=Streptomyces sp. NPDC051561 TaxID=3365658 RepID=UPI0037BDD2C0